MKHIIVCLFVVSSLLSVSQSAWAWGKIGHRVTGEIATQYLSPMAQAAIAELYPNHTLAEISALADFNRSNPAEFWQKESTAYHYVTVPDGKTYAQVGAPEKGDAYTALMMFSNQVINTRLSVADRQTALHFIVHIIGDLHQPLHVGTVTIVVAMMCVWNSFGSVLISIVYGIAVSSSSKSCRIPNTRIGCLVR